MTEANTNLAPGPTARKGAGPLGQVIAGPRTGAGGPRLAVDSRVRVGGKYLYAGSEKFTIQGVAYGPFCPGPDGCDYHDHERVERDFSAMVEHGINTVRTYTVPPVWLLDAASAHGLRVMVGLPWEQHVTFLDDRRTRRRIRTSVREGVRRCAGHPAVLAYTIGNEIPAPIVRWHGHRAIERFLEQLYHIAKAEDPNTLVTYVSYPTTEYLKLPFVDFVSFNVFLEDEPTLLAYLARLQNLADERPLVMTEIGLDSMRNGEHAQAETLAWQIRATQRLGCAGTFLFSWSDEWFRGGHEITDWAFGLTTRDGEPKPALAAVGDAFAGRPQPVSGEWPLISVVVCTYNGSSTIRQCLEGLQRLDYPSFEVLVIDDGSTDGVLDIVREYDVELVQLPENRGLSWARNEGMRRATGEIVAYLDDDAWPDPSWLTHLALAFSHSDHVGIGGPNIAPPGYGVVADCVANAPGGPSHVLHTDLLAEHLPGCNMAFRRTAILAIDGFDPRFHIAGDDVDLCWRLQEHGGTLGFCAGAMVWHHRRSRIKAYLRQQFNYGRAEGMLEAKWPEKYNRLGHMRWGGRLYGKGHTQTVPALGRRIRHGVWGTGLFQAMYPSGTGTLWALTLMPEWYVLIVGLAGIAALGVFWSPLFWFLPVFFAALAIPVVQAVVSAGEAQFTSEPISVFGFVRQRALTTAFHILQPMVRLAGRLTFNLTPWRLHGAGGFDVPYPRSFSHWSERWRPHPEWLEALEKKLMGYRVLVRRGGEFDRWDLEADCGLLGGARLLSTVEEHGQGRQLLRVWIRPRVSRTSVVVVSVMTLLAVLSGIDAAWVACTVLGLAALGFLIATVRECGKAVFSVRVAVRKWQNGKET